MTAKEQDGDGPNIEVAETDQEFISYQIETYDEQPMDTETKAEL